jgi:hypothetical protein
MLPVDPDNFERSMIEVDFVQLLAEHKLQPPA